MHDGIIGERGVRNTVGTTEQHLEWDVWYKLPHLSQAVPWIFVQEAHGDVECSTTPALKSPGVAQSVAGLFSDVEHVDGSHSGSQKRLMSVSPRGIHDQATWVSTDSLSEGHWALLKEHLSETLRAWLRHIESTSARVHDLWNLDFALELGLANLALDLTAIDSQVSEVAQQLLGAVLRADQVEQLWGIINESSPASALDKDRM